MTYDKDQIETLIKRLRFDSNDVCNAYSWIVGQRIKDSADALAAQAARIGELERDAARYRWLRDKANRQAHLLRAPLVLMTNDDCSNEGWRDVLQGAQLDAAIDAASKGKEK